MEINKQELDNYITGHHGEDQFKGAMGWEQALEMIANTPLHPCDDARNAAGLARAINIARTALGHDGTEARRR